MFLKLFLNSSSKVNAEPLWKYIKKYSELFEKSNKYETNNEDEDINPSKIFIERAYEFKRYPPRSAWRGAFILVNK